MGFGIVFDAWVIEKCFYLHEKYGFNLKMEIFVNRHDQVLGPYTDTQISQMIESGTLSVNDSCSVDGQSWESISNFVDIENPTPVLDQDPLTEMPNASKVTAKGPHVLDVQKSAGSKSVKKTKARSITKVTQKKDKLSSSLSVSDSQKKKAYLFNVKSETLYPKFRMYIFIMFIMQIVIGSIVAIFSIFAFLNSEFVYGVVELVLSVSVIFSAYVTREICEIFVDSADSILEKNSREV